MTQTIFEAYNNCKKELESAGIEDFGLESRHIIKHITGLDNTGILTNYTRRLTQFQQNNLTAIIKQRKVRYPLQYILGSWCFFGREFAVGPGVLIPRSDTETLIDKSLELLKEVSSPKILDLCSGSGCIAITLACECDGSDVLAVEKYPEAITYARKNAENNHADNLKIIEGDIFEGCCADEKYDLIVSNPPYITAEDMLTLQQEVSFEPQTALYGGENGLMFYGAIIENYKNSLKPGGSMCFEVGIGQADEVCNMLKNSGFINVGALKDISGIDRVVFATAESI